MSAPLIHWRYLRSETFHRWKRTALTVGGMAMAIALVVLLDVLGRAFADVAVLPFRNLSADLIVQRTATQAAVPKQMGIMLPYSAQPITAAELKRLGAEEGIEKAAGFVLLWNFGAGRFYTLTGIPLVTDKAPLGPGRASEWLLKGRMPAPGAAEILVERHYGAFYRLDPGASVDIGDRKYTVVGIVDIKQGSQIASSNFYLDIDQARALAQLPADAVNQVFLKVARFADTESVKQRIAGWLPQASVASPDTMLKLFGGLSQIVGRFQSSAVIGAALAALALTSMLIWGSLLERRKEMGLLGALGWTTAQVRRQLATEMALQGLLAAMLALALCVGGAMLLSHVQLSMPGSLPGENPVDFAQGGFKAPLVRVALPVTLNTWFMVLAAIAAVVVAWTLGWLLSHRLSRGSRWAAVKGG